MGPVVVVVGPSYEVEPGSELDIFNEFLYHQEESDAVIGIVRVCLAFDEQDFPTVGSINMPIEGRMPLREGWLDLPFLNFLVHASGLTKIALARMDMLGEHADVKMCVDYKEKIGVEQVAEADPVYEHFKGPWNLDGCVSRSSLPVEVKRYFKTIEEPIGLPICCISIGRGPGEIICV